MKNTVKIHTQQMIPAALLEEYPGNSQKQNRHVQKEIKESIKLNGFDETLLVCPRPDGDGYYIVSGNHRYRAGKSLGMAEFPCVVRDDWDGVEQRIQLFRRNYVRGDIDKKTFSSEVDRLITEEAISMDVLRERMGFETPDDFTEYYQQEKDREQKIADAVTGGGSAGGSSTVRMIDDLGVVLSKILELYGDTAPYSFLIFPMSNKNHLYVAATPALKRVLEEVCTSCVEQQIDLNIALGGLLTIGQHHSNFKTSTPDIEKVVRAGSEVGSADIQPVTDINLNYSEDDEEF